MRNCFNVFKNLHTNTGSVITLDELITKIKTPNESAIEATELARDFGKTNSRYQEIKTKEIEVFHPNMFQPTCSKAKGNKGINYPTDYIFLDFDNVGTKSQAERFRDSLSLFDFVSASWLSLSQTGVSALVSVKGNSRQLHPHYWEELQKLMEKPLDSYTKSYSKLCCIPYDPNIHFRYNAIPYTIKSPVIISTGGHVPSYLEREDSKGLVNPHDLSSIHWETPLPLNKFKDINLPWFPDDDFKYLEIDLGRYMKRKIKVGKRNSTIGAIAMILIVLNPCEGDKNEDVLKKQLINGLLHVNQPLYMEELLSPHEVISNFNSNYRRYKSQGYLDVSKYYRKRAYFWHPDCKLSLKEKLRIGQKEKLSKEGRGKEATEQVIHDCIVTLQDGCNAITKKLICEFTLLSQSTVKKYWKPFKTMVDDYNKSLSNDGRIQS